MSLQELQRFLVKLLYLILFIAITRILLGFLRFYPNFHSVHLRENLNGNLGTLMIAGPFSVDQVYEHLSCESTRR
jgi:hypothetical protein